MVEQEQKQTREQEGQYMTDLQAHQHTEILLFPS